MIDAQEIEKIIPHRGDMRLVDEIREYNDTSAVGIKYVRDDEFWKQIQKAQTDIQYEVENVVTVESTDCHELHTNIHPASKIKLSEKLAGYIKLQNN